MLININLNLSEVGKDKIFTSQKTGNKYLAMTVAKMKEKDAYGNDFTVYLYDKQTKAKTYIGKGKSMVFKDDSDFTIQKPEEENKDLKAEYASESDIPFQGVLLWKGDVKTLVFTGIVIIIIAISLSFGIEIGIEKEKSREKNFPDWLCQECNLESQL